MTAMNPTPVGIGGTVVNNIATGLNSDIGPYGEVGRWIDGLTGSKPGKIEGYVGAGRVNDQGDPGASRRGATELLARFANVATDGAAAEVDDGLGLELQAPVLNNAPRPKPNQAFDPISYSGMGEWVFNPSTQSFDWKKAA